MRGPDTGTFKEYKQLKGLPDLVREQRKLEAELAEWARLTKENKTAIEREAAVRKEIAALLVDAGIEKGVPVTCNGFDVTRCERKGAEAYNPTTVIELLAEHDVDRDLVAGVLGKSLESAPPAIWATVKPSAGAKVRRS